VDRAVAQRLGERVVHEPVLVEQRQAGEARARHGHLKMVTSAGPILDAELFRLGERTAQQGFEKLDGHDAHAIASGVPCAAMEEIGLFPLGIVLLPTERVPLHVFEPRYRELVGECLETDGEFGLLYADEDGVREVGTMARVAEVLERFDDGRLNVLVEGRRRFRVERLTRGRSFMTAAVEPVDDAVDAVDADTSSRAAGAFRALAALAGVEAEDPDEGSPQLSFELAAQVELVPDAKQRLLESISEQERLELVAELLDAVRHTLIATRELGDRAKRNGSRIAE
jgi:Lon protease-like protein